MQNFNFVENGYEAPTNQFNFNFGVSISKFYILHGTTNNFSSIWVFNHRLYIGSEGCLNIVDLERHELVDFYTTDYGGEAGEQLDTVSITDINVV